MHRFFEPVNRQKKMYAINTMRKNTVTSKTLASLLRLLNYLLNWMGEISGNALKNEQDSLLYMELLYKYILISFFLDSKNADKKQFYLERESFIALAKKAEPVFDMALKILLEACANPDADEVENTIPKLAMLETSDWTQIDAEAKAFIKLLLKKPVLYFMFEEDLDIDIAARLQFDEQNKLYYAVVGTDRLYYTDDFKQATASFGLSICYEQRAGSPHEYLYDGYHFPENGVVADVGSAEGNLVLSLAGQMSHGYLFEKDERWEKPLRLTFHPYKDKVTVIPKFAGSKNSDDVITLDSVFKDIHLDLLKMDVEGNEIDVFEGAANLLARDLDLTIFTAVYHNPWDARMIRDYLTYKGFDTSYSDGYMIFHTDPYKAGYNPLGTSLLKGLIRAKKKRGFTPFSDISYVCPLCGNEHDNTISLFTEMDYGLRTIHPYLICSVCKSLTLAKDPIEAAEQFILENATVEKREIPIELIIQEFGLDSKNATFLEPCCHDGSLIKEIAKNAAFAVGIDPVISPDHIFESQNCVILQGDITCCDAVFDVVVLREELCRADDPVGFLVQMGALLNDDGIMIVTAPVVSQVYRDLGVHWRQMKPGFNQFITTKEMLCEICSDAGFTVEGSIVECDAKQLLISEYNKLGISTKDVLNGDCRIYGKDFTKEVTALSQDIDHFRKRADSYESSGEGDFCTLILKKK